VNLLLNGFVLAVKPLHNLRAGIRAIVSQHNHSFHFRQRQAHASRLQDKVDVMDDLGSEDAVSSVSSARFGQQTDPLPEPQRFRSNACALRKGCDANCLSHGSPRIR